MTHTRTLALLLCCFVLSTSATDSGRGRHKQMYVVPTPGPVQIDGRLHDWDLSPQIEMFVIAGTRNQRHARIAAMYDKEAFYLSGEVRDDSPMMNRHDPRVNPERAWDADVCQFRLVIDPEAGYPVTETTFQYKRDKERVDQRDDIIHMTLWHYTDDGSAHLQMSKGMTYRPIREAWEKGLVPPEHFDAAYRAWDDGKGYTFEYRIPWATMGAEQQPLDAGDEVAGTVMVTWSTPDGLAHVRMQGAAYDLMGAPGFPFQATDTWGKLIFSPTNNVPEALVREGLPVKRALPLEFTYELPRQGETTIQLFKPDGTMARMIVAQKERPAGTNSESWDGLDASGDILPAGEYQWRGIVSDPITEEYRFSVHNSGRPPYTTDDGKGGWGGDHGTPHDVVALADGLLLAWDSAEYGSGVIRIDEDGTKQWGTQSGAMVMAGDGERYYTAGDRGFHRGTAITMFEVSTARPTLLPSGVESLSPPPGGTAETNRVSGLAWGKETLYASYQERNLLVSWSTTTGELLTTWQVDQPGALDLRPNGELAVISGERVLCIHKDGPRPWLTEHLDEPAGIAIADDGTAFVSNRGELQNVSVYSPAGKYLRSIGKAGGRPLIGAYDAGGMLEPAGIAVDGRGRLWVAETLDGPKRFSVWNTQTGENLAEYFGAAGYFAYGNIDPARPTEILAHHMLWEIDWATDTVTPISTIWRKLGPNMVGPPNPYAYQGMARLVTADNGEQYLYGGSRQHSVIMKREGDIFKPFAAIFTPNTRGTGIAVIDDQPEKYPTEGRDLQSLLWQDANADQRVQEDELTVLAQEYRRSEFGWLHDDLSVHISHGQVWEPARITEAGQPIYQPTTATPSISGRLGSFAPLPDGTFIKLQHHRNRQGPLPGPSLMRLAANGEMLWNYPNLQAWRDSLNLPTIQAGRLWAMTGMMGVTDRFFAHQTYFGPNQIFRLDGQYVGQILYDRRELGRGPFAGQSEGQGGSFHKLVIDGKERYVAIGGSNDVRVWEIHGLSTLQDLPGGAYVHTAEQEAQARAAKAAYDKAMAGPQTVRIVSGGKQALAEAPANQRRLEDGRGFNARLAYDPENLYVQVEVTTPHELINAAADPRILFRGGNLLDIQIAADPRAEKDRERPAPGDARLLVTRQNGNPYAVLFQPTLADAEGEPTVLTSPTGKESFDRIAVVDTVGLEYHKRPRGFEATVTIPQPLLGLDLAPGQRLKLDLGYVFGNSEGTRSTIRAYLFNTSFTANVVDDIPHESRLEPHEWGEAMVE